MLFCIKLQYSVLASRGRRFIEKHITGPKDVLLTLVLVVFCVLLSLDGG